MFPGMSPREMQKAMKRLGIKQEEIDAQLVIIKTSSKDLIIKNPQVSKVNMMGQESIQIVGDIEEIEQQQEIEVTEDDISTVTEQSGCTREEALSAIKDSNGDLAQAIMSLAKK